MKHAFMVTVLVALVGCGQGWTKEQIAEVEFDWRRLFAMSGVDPLSVDSVVSCLRDATVSRYTYEEYQADKGDVITALADDGTLDTCGGGK